MTLDEMADQIQAEIRHFEIDLETAADRKWFKYLK